MKLIWLARNPMEWTSCYQYSPAKDKFASVANNRSACLASITGGVETQHLVEKLLDVCVVATAAAIPVGTDKLAVQIHRKSR